MRPKLLFLYGVLCHAAFLGVYAWMAAFIGGLLLERTIDAPAAPFSWGAVAFDAGLVALFALPHSIMARPGFKARWTRIVPAEIERSTYVLVSSALMAVLLMAWQPIGPVIWDVTHPVGRNLLWGLFAAGWLMVPTVTLLIHHFDLFGTRQVWLALQGRPYTHIPFRVPGVYRLVRHPLYVGWAIAFWCIPTMTAGHLVFAISASLYMRLAIPFEERDLIEVFGDEYRDYRARVPALLPVPRRAARAPAKGA